MSDKQITWIAISVSVLLHLALAGFLLFGPSLESDKKIVKPVAIKAKIIDLKPKSSNKPIPTKQSSHKTPKKPVDTKALERKKELQKKREQQKQREQQKKLELQKQRLKQLEQKRKAKKLEQEKQKKLAQQKAAQEKAKKEKALKEKKERERKEKLKKEQELKEKQLKEKQRQEKLKKEKLQKEKEKKERERKEKERKEKERLDKEKKEKERKQKELKEKQRKAQEQAERDALARAMAAEEAEFQEEENEQMASEYGAIIKKKIAQNWNRPPDTKNGMVVELLIELLPNGMVSSVSISKSSGNDRFDRSAMNAVNKAGQFDVLADAPSDVFENYFRRFTLRFKPEDLAN